MKTELIEISLIKKNPDNPRYIDDHKFGQLVQSIKDFPEMLNIRPIVVNDDMMILGGNMRLSACIDAGLTEVPIIKASQFTEAQQKEFIIKDNVGFGSWDWDKLANEWDSEQLQDWGLEISNFDFSGSNQEINTDQFPDEMIIKLKYNEADFQTVNTKLNEIADDYGEAVLKLLNE